MFFYEEIKNISNFQLNLERRSYLVFANARYKHDNVHLLSVQILHHNLFITLLLGSIA